MMPDRISERPRYRAIGLHNITALPQWHKLTPAQQEALMVVGQVLPFRTNDYVVNELKDGITFQLIPSFSSPLHSALC